MGGREGGRVRHRDKSVCVRVYRKQKKVEEGLQNREEETRKGAAATAAGEADGKCVWRCFLSIPSKFSCCYLCVHVSI